MKSFPIRLLLVALLPVACLACGDDTSQPEELCPFDPEVEPQDCAVPIPDDYSIDSLGDFEPFCESACSRVETSFSITGVEGLTNLKPLSRIKDIRGTLNIINNPDLESLDGLDSLQSTRGFKIERNHRLETLHGLENLSGRIWNLFIWSNDGLQSLEGLGPVRISPEAFPAAQIDIYQNKNLREVDAFHSIVDMKSNGGIRISESPKLTRIHAFENLQHAGRLDISNNAALTEVSGFSSLETLQSLLIENNTSLPTCRANELRDSIDEIRSFTSIENNGDGECN